MWPNQWPARFDIVSHIHSALYHVDVLEETHELFWLELVGDWGMNCELGLVEAEGVELTAEEVRLLVL